MELPSFMPSPDLVRAKAWCTHWEDRHQMPGSLVTKFYYREAWNRMNEMEQLEREEHERNLAKIKSPAKSGEDRTEGNEPRWYFATFTQPDTSKDPQQILKNTRKIFKSKMVSPITWCYSLELMKNGTPHTHAAFYTKKYPEFKKVGKFNVSDVGVPWRYDISGARYPTAVNAYVLKTDTKPDKEYLKEYNLTECVWLADNFPPELIPCPNAPT